MDKNELKKVKFVELRSQGYTFKEISDELKVSKPTLIKWSSSLSNDICNQLEIYKEEIRKEFKFNYRRRLEFKAKLLTQIENALENADWTKASPIKLIEIANTILESVDDKNEFSEEGILTPFNTITWES